MLLMSSVRLRLEASMIRVLHGIQLVKGHSWPPAELEALVLLEAESGEVGVSFL